MYRNFQLYDVDGQRIVVDRRNKRYCLVPEGYDVYMPQYGHGEVSFIGEHREEEMQWLPFDGDTTKFEK